MGHVSANKRLALGVVIGWLGHRRLDCFLSEADFALLAYMGLR
jgi:hypothetical protein